MIENWFYLENDLLDREDLTIYEKMIYIVIARYIDKEDKAFPSVPTIAKKGSMSIRQVQMIINSLIKKGLIKKESRINKYNKSKTSNLLANNVNKTVSKPVESNLKMVNRRRDKDYIRKVIRINPNYIVICDFLDFYTGYKGKSKFEFYNDLFNYSLKKISSDIGYKFKKSPASDYGITRSFFLNKKTYDLLHATYKKSQELYKKLYDDYLSMGNFTELILYIYITSSIEKKILDVFKFNFGIEKIT